MRLKMKRILAITAFILASVFSTANSAYADYTTDSYDQEAEIVNQPPVLGGLKMSDVTDLPKIRRATKLAR